MTDGQTVYMAGDSFCGDDQKKDGCRDPKVHLVGPIGVGIAGHVRHEIILERILRKKFHGKTTRDFDPEAVHNWLKFTLPDSLSSAVAKRTAGKEESGERNSMDGSTYLIGAYGRIYYVEDDYAVWEPNRNIASVGCGAQYALGALDALRELSNPIDPVVVLKKALQVASKWNSFVMEPYTFIEVPGLGAE